MTYIDSIVDKVREATHIKDNGLVQAYALLVLIKGTDITRRDVHDAWAMNMNFKPRTDKCFGYDHKSIVPFSYLAVDVQEKDDKYVEALKKVAKKLDFYG